MRFRPVWGQKRPEMSDNVPVGGWFQPCPRKTPPYPATREVSDPSWMPRAPCATPGGLKDLPMTQVDPTSHVAAIITVAEEIARVAPDCAERALKIIELARELEE